MSTSSSDSRGRGLRRKLVRAFLIVAVSSIGEISLGWTAQAHGKELNVGVTCTAPDPGRPLNKVCTVTLRYPDGDPVVGADVQVSAIREGKGEAPFRKVVFTPADQQGVYSSAVTFPAYGTWKIRFSVTEPGRGEAEIVENILPPVPGTASEIRARLRVVTSFGPDDIRNIALRILHLIPAITWLGLTGLVFVGARFASPQERARILRRLAVGVPWGVGASILLLAVTGIFSAIYNTPNRPPGLFAPRALVQLPFGEAYLIAFLLKAVLSAGMIVTTLALAVSLRRNYGPRLRIISGGAEFASHESDPFFSAMTPEEPSAQAVGRLAGANLVMGLLVLLDLVVLLYLHVLSHVGAAVI